jgi:hypothetical protein
VSGNNGTAGTANTGGGGGGGGYTPATFGNGANGGSGIVLFKISGSITATSTDGSPTRYETGGYTYYKFTDTGSITF